MTTYQRTIKAMQKSAGADGNGTSLSCEYMSVAGVHITGTFSATVNFEGSIDGSSWFAISALNISTGASATTATAAGVFQLDVSAITALRARISSWASGSVTAYGYAQEQAGFSTQSVPSAVSIGATADNGPAWTSAYLFTASADATGGVDITTAPTSGKKIVVTDILISANVAMYVSFLEETSSTEIGRVYLPASGSAQITPRSTWKLPTANKKLRIDASAAGAVAVTCWYYSEA